MEGSSRSDHVYEFFFLLRFWGEIKNSYAMALARNITAFLLPSCRIELNFISLSEGWSTISIRSSNTHSFTVGDYCLILSYSTAWIRRAHIFRYSHVESGPSSCTLSYIYLSYIQTGSEGEKGKGESYSVFFDQLIDFVTMSYSMGTFLKHMST